jgi:hypothetical protein
MIELALGVIIGLLGVLVARFNLRDFLAWKILEEEYKNQNIRKNPVHPDELAHWAYVMADAMIKAKDKK